MRSFDWCHLKTTFSGTSGFSSRKTSCLEEKFPSSLLIHNLRVRWRRYVSQKFDGSWYFLCLRQCFLFGLGVLTWNVIEDNVFLCHSVNNILGAYFLRIICKQISVTVKPLTLVIQWDAFQLEIYVWHAFSWISELLNLWKSYICQSFHQTFIPI